MNIPKGYKLVPVEPTEEMRNAFGAQAMSGAYNEQTLVGDMCGGVYAAMLEAAPTPPQPIYDEAEERALFEQDYHHSALARDGDEYIRMSVQLAWEGWEKCAQSRAKAGEDE